MTPSACIRALFAPFVAAACFLQSAPGHAENTGPLAQNYQPAPAIWKLADEDTTIYLFGTIHLLPEGFRWRSEQFDAIVDEADELILESSSDDALDSMIALAPKMEALGENRTATSLQLAPGVRDKWRYLVEASGAQFQNVDMLPLPLAVLGIGFDFAGSATSSYEFGVETVLEAQFKATGRPIGSIENHAAVLIDLMRIDEDVLLRDLERDLALWGGKNIAEFTGEVSWYSSGDDWQMEHDWARGIVAEEFDLGLGNGKLGHAFTRVLLSRRNLAWARWLDNRLDQPGTILVAVGAGHFEGEDSVLIKLQDRGLSAERIN